MISLPTVIHPAAEPEFTPKQSEISALVADTFNGKIHIKWDPQAKVTTLRQLAFFKQYLKMGHRFLPWVEEGQSLFGAILIGEATRSCLKRNSAGLTIYSNSRNHSW